jgi:hypothetical protein
MRLTGNSDPTTGKKEYDTGDGTTVYMSDDEFTNTFGVAPSMVVEPMDYTATELPTADLGVAAPTAPQKMPDSAFVQPNRMSLGNFGLVPPTTPTPTPQVTTPISAPAISGPASVGPSGIKYTEDTGLPVDPPTPSAPDTSAMDTSTSAGLSKLTESTTTARPLSKELLKAQDEAFKKQGMAVASEAEAEIARNNAATIEAQAVAQREAKFLEEETARQQREQDAIDERQAKLDAISEEYSDMNLDSNRFWNNKSTGDKILAAIAIGLGAMGQAQSGGENQALNIIQGAIDRDIEEQKHNIAKAGSNVATQKGLFSDVLRRTGDERLARLKTHEMGLKAVAGQYLQLKAQANNDFVRAKADQGLALVEQGLVKNRVDQAATVSTSVKDVVAKPAAPIEVPSTIGAPLRDAATKLNVWKNLEEEYAKVGKARLEDIAGPIDQTQQNIYKMLGWAVPADAAALRAETDIARFKFVKAMTGAGVNVEELRQYEKILPNLSNNPETAVAIIKSLRQSATRDLRQLVESETRLNPQYAPSIMRAYGPYLFDIEDKKSKYGAKPVQGK